MSLYARDTYNEYKSNAIFLLLKKNGLKGSFVRIA